MTSPTPTLATLLESYFAQRLIQQRHASPATIRTYSDALRLLLIFAAGKAQLSPERLTIQHLDREVVLAFLDDLEQTRQNTIRTRNARRAAIRAFFHYVAYLDPTAMGVVQRVLAIPTKRTVKPLLGYLSTDELQAVLNAPDRHTRQGRRDYAVLLFLARTGARVSEVIGVNFADLHFEGKAAVRLVGKGRRERLTPLGTDVAGVLRELAVERQAHLRDALPVFTNSRGQRLTRFGITHLVHRAVTVAAQHLPTLATRAISPHTFRHTTAMHLLQAGVDLSIIRSWLGHVDIETTHHYIEADLRMKERALEQGGLVEANAGRYTPSDAVLALLERYR
jgi:site-specific recombinase XerD